MVIEADLPLIGRDEDLARLDAFLTDVPRGGGSLAVLGQAGVGKTALLTATARRAGQLGIRVMSIGGVQYRAQIGYGALRQLLESSPESRLAAGRIPALATVLGCAQGRTPGDEAVAESLLALVSKLSAGHPIVLILDDTQWLDRASAAVLGRVARLLPGCGVGVLCAARMGEESFFDCRGIPALDLGPLRQDAAEELLTRSFPGLAAPVRRQLIAAAEGNPLALLELPAALTDAQRTEPRALPEQLPLTRRLQATFASRVEGLSAPTRHLLLLAALEGSGNLQVVRRAVAGKCHLKHLAPAERARLIDVDDVTGRLAFRHPLMRSAVVALSTSDQRRGAHRALAAAWHDTPEQRAWHLARAVIEPDESIAALLEEVADLSSRRGDGPNAVAGLLRSADLSPDGTERARRLAKAAYVGAILTGYVRDVPKLLNSARHAAPEADSLAEAVAAAVYALNIHGDIRTAHRLLTGAFASQPAPYDTGDSTVAEALSLLLMACVHSGRDGQEWADYDAVAAKCTSVPEALYLLRRTFADPARARPGDWARLDAALAALPGEPDPARIVRIATAAAHGDRLGAVDGQLRRTARGGSAGTNCFPAIQASFLWGSHAWSTGQWIELREVVGYGLALCAELDYPLRAWTGKWTLACLAAVQGDLQTAGALADEIELWAAPRRAQAVRCYAAHIRTLIALSQNDFERAYHHAQVITPAGELAPFAGHAVWTILDQVEAAVRSGRRQQGLDHAAAARKAGLEAVSPRLRMIVLASAALVAEDDQKAARLFQEALSVVAVERWPFDTARVQLYFGELLRRSKAPARARWHLDNAVETFTRLGAAPWTERASKELRACGAPVHVPPRPEGVALTPQQREIAALAAAGLTNKQIAEKLFLSPRTVSSHLYQLFPKLGITSRAALRDALEPIMRG
ncbi:AAA family ATPase [Catenulispora sp. NL8]|uniref:AAA family ATPase n=1 Tax=Catenulispora pinistramenti TaxID=2705254 RepID=A0ABS5L0Y5_9ACTN|nr:LuxR family transcriptional regulator [Catenulispora pinistramenti]MBS2551905.1 AAA family ATPase [Catenulispora pinistramenti]